MKKIFAVVFSLLLLGAAVTIYAASGRESKELPPQEIQIQTGEDHGYQQKDINKVVRFKTLPDGSIVTQDSSGTTDFYIPSDRVTYITKATQLSSWWNAATAGQSVYFAKPGETVLFDLHKLYTSGTTAGAGASPFYITPAGVKVAWTGVTVVLPNADLYSGPAYNVTIGIVSTGVTGYASAITGATTVYVVPFQGAAGGVSPMSNGGVSAYGKPALYYWNASRSGCTPQNMLQEWMTTPSLSGTSIVQQAIGGSGASYWGLSTFGNVTFQMERSGSSVSTWIVKRHGTLLSNGK